MWRKVARAGAMAGLLACIADHGPNISGVDGAQISSVNIQPLADTLFIPDTVRATDRLQLVAIATATTGATVKNLRYVWVSSDTSIARVDSIGLVTPIRTGTVAITASAARIGTATVVILPAANRIVVTPAIDTIFVDDPIVSTRDTVRLSVAAFDSAGARLTGVRYRWQSATTASATVDSLGTVRAIGLGSSVLTIRSPLLQTTATVAVLPVVRNVVITDPLPQSVDGDTVQLVARAFDYSNGALTRKFAWRSLNPTVATIDTNGRVIFVAPGSATLTAMTSFVADSVTVTSLPRQLVSVDVGGDYVCGVATLGRAYCWGKGTVGQLGSTADSTCFDDLPVTRVGCAIAPKRVIAPAIAFSVVSAGEATACGISAAQQLYCWGDDASGQIGNGSGGGGAEPRLATVASERFTSLSSGGAHACALNLAGFAYCWGKDSTGQLGDARNIPSTTPIPVIGPDAQPSGALRFAAISAGANHTCAIASEDRRAWCWGAGSRGILGVGDTIQSSVPRPVAGGRSFVAISAGTDHTCAIGTDNAVYCWGDNLSGQLGLGTTVPAFSAIPVPSLALTGYTAISSGLKGSCALHGSGNVACWGSNDYGQLGRGEPLTTPQPGSFSATPSSVLNLSKSFTSLSVGRRSACAIASDNTTLCWGSNFLGSLGNQLQAAIRTTPVLVARLR